MIAAAVPRSDASAAPAVAAFDFDGTLTRHDTMWLFLRHAFGRARLWAGVALCAPWLAAYAVGLLDGGSAKQRLLSHFLRGMSGDRFGRLAADFGATYASREIKPKARAALSRHLAAGHRVVVVTASVRQWVEPFVSEWPGVSVVATELAVDAAGRLTGRLGTPNCRGEEKWRRLTALIPDLAERRLIAYGDSAGDRALLARAHEPHYRDL